MTVTFTCGDCRISIARTYTEVRGVGENALADFTHRLRDHGWHIPDNAKTTHCPRCYSVVLAANKRDREAGNPDAIDTRHFG